MFGVGVVGVVGVVGFVGVVGVVGVVFEGFVFVDDLSDMLNV